MAKKEKVQEKIQVKDELTELQKKWSDAKYHDQKYLKDSEIILSGSDFAELLNATSSYAQAMKDTKTLLKDVYNYYATLETSISKIQIKLAEIHCNNVDAGLTETMIKEEETDGK